MLPLNAPCQTGWRLLPAGVGYRLAMGRRARRIVQAAARAHKRFGEVQGGGLAATLTLAAFLSLFPLLLLGVAVTGFIAAGRADLNETVISTLGLTGDAGRFVTSTIESAAESREAASLIGLGGLLWSGLGVAGALQSVYDSVWQISGRGWRDKVVGLLWLAGAALVFVASIGATALLQFVPLAAPVGVLLGVAVNTGLFLWASMVLPNRPAPWRELFPGALFGGICLEILSVVGGIYVPRAVASSSALYGSLGVIFAMLAWLAIFARVVVYSAVMNVLRWEDRHGTVTAEIRVPRLPGMVTLETTRSGQAVPHPVNGHR